MSMYNARPILAGLAVFLTLFTAPFRFGVKDIPEPATVAATAEQNGKGRECVENADFMRKRHGRLLARWRDLAVRQGARVYTSAKGRTWDISLEKNCLACHSGTQFCTACHTRLGASPGCWSCHLSPEPLKS